MQAVLRVLWVMFAARSLGVFGQFVPTAWHVSRRPFGTQYLEQCAHELRALAVLPGDNPVIRGGFNDPDLDGIRAALRALNYGNAKYLLLITAGCEAIQGRPCGGSGPPSDLGHTLSTGPPPGMPELHMVDPRTVGPRVRELLDRVTDMHLHHGPSSDFRVLANWPNFLEIALDDVPGGRVLPGH